MHTTSFLSSLLFGALFSSPCVAAMDREALVLLSASVLKIEALRTQGGYSLGSGVLVGVDKVATNCHVTRDAREIRVVRGDNRWVVRAQASDVKRDLCVLQVEGIPAGVTTLGRADQLKVGQSVTALGFTGGTGIQNSAGGVVALHRFEGSRVIQSSNWFSSGASGGGLFDDDKRLVGILTFRLRGGATHYFAAPVEWLLPMLADASRYQRVAPLETPALAYWQDPVEVQPDFLKAAVLERDKRWPELESLALAWSRRDAGDSEPWYFQGVALGQLEQWPDARRALERAVAIEPAASDAWFRLGLLYTRLGFKEQARRAQRTLQELDPDLALELHNAMEKI